MKFEKWIYFIRETNNDLSCSILVKREYCCHAIYSFKIILSSRVKRFWVIGMGSSIKYVRKIFRKTSISNPLIRTRKSFFRKILRTYLMDGSYSYLKEP